MGVSTPVRAQWLSRMSARALYPTWATTLARSQPGSRLGPVSAPSSSPSSSRAKQAVPLRTQAGSSVGAPGA